MSYIYIICPIFIFILNHLKSKEIKQEQKGGKIKKERMNLRKLFQIDLV